MIALRSEALELARHGGGSLFTEIRDAIQRRIDFTERLFHRRFWDFNPQAYLKTTPKLP